MASGEAAPSGGLGPASDPLSLFMQQRRTSPVSPAGSQGVPSPAGAAVPSASSSQPKSPAGPLSLFDVESSLGRNVSARHGADAQASSHERLECALAPGSNVTFPTITEICELLSARPADVPGAVEILLRSLGPRSLPRRRLKALTILNEVVHDEIVAAHVRRAPGALSILQQLQDTRGTGLGAEADGQIRMFSTELERRIFLAPAEEAPRPRAAAAPRPQAPTPQARGSGLGTGLEDLDPFRRGAQAGGWPARSQASQTYSSLGTENEEWD